MSVLDDFDFSLVQNDDAVIIKLRFMIKFVFKRDLTKDQISVLNELSSRISSYDDNTNTVCEQITNRIFIYKRDGEKYYEFLQVKIPFELADLLCYIECWNEPNTSHTATILFKSDLLVRQNQFLFNREKPRAVKLSEILIPLLFEKTVLLGDLDIFTAEMIASHFFFNPEVVTPNKKGVISYSNSWCKEDKIRSAYKNTQKIIVIDESQKVKMYSSNTEAEEEIGYIETWLKNSRAYNIRVKSATDDSIHHIMCLILFYYQSSDRDYRIIAFS